MTNIEAVMNWDYQPKAYTFYVDEMGGTMEFEKAMHEYVMEKVIPPGREEWKWEVLCLYFYKPTRGLTYEIRSLIAKIEVLLAK